MPIVDHPVFIAPDSPEQKLWRYMDFTKLLFLLENQKLYFSSIHTLSEMDPFEGSLAKGDMDFRTIKYGDYIEHTKDTISEDVFKKLQKAFSKIGEFQKEVRKACYANCWHMNDHESAAMWSTYINNSDGIAITSDFTKIKNSFQKAPQELYAGKVLYVDYATTAITENDTLYNTFYPSTYKRKSFEHEKELRIFYADLGGFLEKKKELTEGVSIPVQIDILIDEVIISPNASKWYTDLVIQVLKRYGLENKVKESSMNSTPFF